MLDDTRQTDWQHKACAAALEGALEAGTGIAWMAFRVVLIDRLTPAQRAGLAYAALTSLPPDQAEDVMALAAGAGDWPLPWYLGGMEEPRAWASMSGPRENKAMALACFEALPTDAQAGFMDHIAHGDRKRALVALWNSLPESDRAAFLDIVDPGPAGGE